MTGHPRIVGFFHAYARAAGAFGAALGGLVLLGWSLDIAVLKSVVPGLAAMMPNTAVSIGLAGVSLWLTTGRNAHAPPPRWRAHLASVAAGAVALIATLTLAQYVLGWNAGIDDLLFSDDASPVGTAGPGRMSPNTATALLLLGLALLPRDAATRQRPGAAQLLAIASGAIGLVALMSYGFSMLASGQLVSYTLTALHTSVALVALSLGVLAAHPTRGISNLLTSDSTAGTAMRRLLPTAFVVPIFIAAVRVLGQRAGLYGTEVGIGILTTAGALLMAAVTCWVCQSLLREELARTAADLERSRSREALELERSYFQELFESAPAAILVLDNERRVVRANREFTRLFGYAFEEVRQRPVDDFFVPEEQLGERRTRTSLEAPWEVVRRETTRLCRDGTRLHVSVQTIPIKTEGGQVGVYAIYQDVSDQKRMVATLARRTSQLQTIADAMGTYLGCGDWPETSRVLLRGALNQTQSGYGFAGVVTAGSVFRIIAHEGIVWDESENRSFHENALRTYREQRYLEFTNLNDLFGQVIATGQAVLSNEPASDPRAGGVPPGHPPLRCFLGVPILSGTDVVGMIGVVNRPGGYTRQDQAALEILAQPAGVLYDSYHRQERETLLQEQLRQAQKMEAIGHLAGGIAHDFNNILTVILGCAGMLAIELGAGDPRCGDVEQIKQAGTRAADLVRQLLAFSRRQVLRPRRLNLNEVVTGAHAMLHRLIGEHIEATTVLDPGVGTIVADAGHLEQIVTNLVVNARDAMPTGGRLTIETANVNPGDADAQRHVQLQSRPWVRLAVSDTGHGMDAQTKSRIFEPFFTTKERGKGTGLGLSTVYGVVKQSEGFIWVDSEPGLGTTFRIYLPRVEGTAEQIDHAENTAGELSGSEVVLLVEDEPAVLTLASRTLRQQGYTVIEAGRADEALRIGQSHPGPIDLIVTDVVMPQMSGPDLVDRLLATRSMKVIFISGFTEATLVQEIMARNVTFLEKPFSPLALLRVVRETLVSTK